MGDSDQIRATVDLFDGGTRAGDGDTKLRVTIWSGSDFRSPTLTRGGIFDNRHVAFTFADRVVEALELLGIPVAGVPDAHEAAEPLLAEQVEGQEYPRLG